MSWIATAQTLVHASNCTLVVPGILLVVSAGLFAYRGVTEDKFDLPLNGFLFNIMLQMMPLVALKFKIWSCNDRVSLVPLVLVKTMLMHVALSTMRVVSQAIEGVSYRKSEFAFDVAALVGAVMVLHFVFQVPLTLVHYIKYQDVRNLVIMATAAAFAAEAYFVYVVPWWEGQPVSFAGSNLQTSKILFVAANYVDILAFMPVVWRLYQVENEMDDFSIGTKVSNEARTQARWFFLYVCGFYFWDDVFDAIMTLSDEPIAMMAHGAHYMLLLDFAGFFSFQVTSPQLTGVNKDKEKGEQLQGLLSNEGLDQDI
mmetsp:Transcript_67040/g.160680  ORF Transcript_67040/g.160680 Transcript_67040/m.160680 type:complete len:313 (+) Transcript_67040:58-996(+)